MPDLRETQSGKTGRRFKILIRLNYDPNSELNLFSYISISQSCITPSVCKPKMSSYPLSSLPQNRLCFPYADEVCPTYPCAHTPCHDPDWLEEEEDLLRDYDFVFELWCCYESLNKPSSMLEKKARTPPERWAAFELKFDRCRRIEAKQEKIDRDIKE